MQGPYQPTLQAVQYFQVVQMILGKDIMLPYFCTQKHTTMQTDASIKGLGAVVIQNEVPVYFASRTHIAAKKNYQNLEHEILATTGVWNPSATSYLVKKLL